MACTVRQSQMDALWARARQATREQVQMAVVEAGIVVRMVAGMPRANTGCEAQVSDFHRTMACPPPRQVACGERNQRTERATQLLTQRGNEETSGRSGKSSPSTQVGVGRSAATKNSREVSAFCLSFKPRPCNYWEDQWRSPSWSPVNTTTTRTLATIYKAETGYYPQSRNRIPSASFLPQPTSAAMHHM